MDAISKTASAISVDEVMSLLGRHVPITFVDARNPIAWGSSNVKLPNARRVPIDEVDRHVASLPATRLIVYCT